MALIRNYSLYIDTGDKEELYVPYWDYTIRDTDDSLVALVVTALVLIKAGLTPVSALFIPKSAKGRLPRISEEDHKAIKRVQDELKVLLEREVGFEIRYD
jgi:hypothetical protein